MWINIAVSFVVSFLLLLFNQFIISNSLFINIFTIVIICLCLRQTPSRWFYAVWGGLLLDLAYGSYGINLLCFLALVYLFNLFTLEISFNNFFALILLIIGGVTAFLFFNFLIITLFGLFFVSFFHYSFALSFFEIINFLLINSIIIGLILLIFKKKTATISYETF